MMRKLGRYFVLLITTLIHPVANAPLSFGQQNDLFSSVRASTVFSDSVAGSPPTAVSSENSRMTSADALVRMLQQADFSASAEGSRSAALIKELDSWQFPVLVTLSDDEQELRLVFGLRAISDPQKVPAARLLRLLEQNQKTGRAAFVFNRERGRIEMLSLVRNLNLQAAAIRDEINRMAILARDTESLWNLEESEGGTAPVAAGSEQELASGKSSGKGSGPATPRPDVTTPAAEGSPARQESGPQSSAAGMLQGRWAASRSASEAFALQFNADSTFALVSVMNGRQSRASGKFTIETEQLTLEGSDGTRLVGSIRMVSATEFQFTQRVSGQSAAALIFRKAP